MEIVFDVELERAELRDDICVDVKLDCLAFGLSLLSSEKLAVVESPGV